MKTLFNIWISSCEMPEIITKLFKISTQVTERYCKLHSSNKILSRSHFRECFQYFQIRSIQLSSHKSESLVNISYFDWKFPRLESNLHENAENIFIGLRSTLKWSARILSNLLISRYIVKDETLNSRNISISIIFDWCKLNSETLRL